MLRKLTKIKRTERPRRAYSHRKTWSIKAMLREAGYNDAEIKKMLQNHEILIAPDSLRRRLQTGETLYIRENADESDSDCGLEASIDRFRDLDLE